MRIQALLRSSGAADLPALEEDAGEGTPAADESPGKDE
jgi:hypothetical protein